MGVRTCSRRILANTDGRLWLDRLGLENIGPAPTPTRVHSVGVVPPLREHVISAHSRLLEGWYLSFPSLDRVLRGRPLVFHYAGSGCD